jgi:hypothetical protein
MFCVPLLLDVSQMISGVIKRQAYDFTLHNTLVELFLKCIAIELAAPKVLANSDTLKDE